MRVERRAADVRSVDDLLDGQRLEALFLDERPQRSSNELLSPLDTSIPSLRHLRDLSFLEHSNARTCSISDKQPRRVLVLPIVTGHNVVQMIVCVLQNTCSEQ